MVSEEALTQFNQTRLETLLALAIEGGAIAMRYFGKLDAVQTKPDCSPLTEADLAVDTHLHDGLSAAFPDIPIVTEERTQSQIDAVDARRFFLVDPIDGTKEFVAERGEFTVNVGLVEDGVPIAGAICAPAAGIAFAGLVGSGAWQCEADGGGRHAIAVSRPDNEALVAVASRSHLTPATTDFLAANKIAGTTNAGSSLKFCRLACGQADLYPRFGPTMEWDTAAGHAVLVAAGGLVEEPGGAPLRYGKPGYRNGDFIAYAAGARFVLPNRETA